MFGANDRALGPDFLVEEDVIVVTFDFRIHIFGFLSLGTPEISGNQGLKDQQMAMKFISENIEDFGGDKNRITIGGISAGKIFEIFSLNFP